MKSSKKAYDEISCLALLRESSWVENYISISNLKLASLNCYCCVFDTVTAFAHFVRLKKKMSVLPEMGIQIKRLLHLA